MRKYISDTSDRRSGNSRCLYENLNAAAEEWLRSSAESCKLSTAMTYRSLYERRLAPLLGQKKIADINREDVRQAIFENPVLCGRKPSANFTKKTFRELMRILEFSEEKVDFKELTRGLTIPQERHKPIETFTPYEQRKLTSFLLSDLNESKLGILFSLMTGCRLGEICALETENISLDNQIVHICSTVQRIRNPEMLVENIPSSAKKTMLIITAPKTETSDRFVPLHKDLVGILRNNMPAGRFFINNNCVMDPRTFEYRFFRYQKDAGIRPRKFHVLRHTFATNCVAGGMSAKVLSEILGHSSVTTTMSLYVHPTMDMKKNQLDNAFTNLHIL